VPTLSGIIDSLVIPPIGTLIPCLDSGGPYYAGSWSFNTFTTPGAGAMPAGTYSVHWTYGVIAIVNGTIPAGWGWVDGFDSGSALGSEGYYYHNRFCQIVPMHELLSGLLCPMEVIDVHRPFQINTWPLRLIGGDQLGLHVSPGISIDLYYLCVL